jgi:low temperature requirement protein LtrA
MPMTHALIERFGAFVIIVLGETVTGVVAGLAHNPTRPINLGVGTPAILVGFGSWWTYFDFAGHRRPRETRAASLFWMLVQRTPARLGPSPSSMIKPGKPMWSTR